MSRGISVHLARTICRFRKDFLSSIVGTFCQSREDILGPKHLNGTFGRETRNGTPEDKQSIWLFCCPRSALTPPELQQQEQRQRQPLLSQGQRQPCLRRPEATATASTRLPFRCRSGKDNNPTTTLKPDSEDESCQPASGAYLWVRSLSRRVVMHGRCF